VKKNWILPAIWLLIITGLSVMPGAQIPKIHLFSMDKLGHLLAYGVLCGLVLRAAQPNRTNWRSRAIWAILFASMYGILMEIIQFSFVPGRFYEYADMMANAFGALLGACLYLLGRMFKFQGTQQTGF
jgi:VanZ family protein